MMESRARVRTRSVLAACDPLLPTSAPGLGHSTRPRSLRRALARSSTRSLGWQLRRVRISLSSCTASLFQSPDHKVHRDVDDVAAGVRTRGAAVQVQNRLLSVCLSSVCLCGVLTAGFISWMILLRRTSAGIAMDQKRTVKVKSSRSDL